MPTKVLSPWLTDEIILRARSEKARRRLAVEGSEVCGNGTKRKVGASISMRPRRQTYIGIVRAKYYFGTKLKWAVGDE